MWVPLDARVARLKSWLKRANDRPLVGFCLGSYYPLHRYPEGSRTIPNGVVSPDDIVVENFLDDTDRLYEQHQAAGGDLIWAATPFCGMPWLEASLGCGVIADHRSGSTRSTPPPGFAEHPVIPEFTEANPWVAKMLEFIPALERRSGGRFPVGVTLMRGISDLLAALYGSDGFILRMYDEPDEVHAVVEQLTGFWIAFGRALLKHLPLFRGGTGSFFWGLWCPGKMIWLQEDAAAVLSPALYEKFIYPADCRIAHEFEHCLMHLHPSRLIPTAQLARTDLGAIELHLDHDGPTAASLVSHYKTVLERKPLIVAGDATSADLECLMRLPHQGLALSLVAGSVDEARRTWEQAMTLGFWGSTDNSKES
ncbi:MAG: hypothetical protein LLG20_10200 [Acidobacteriales bacterium]|nr:hypothetical protein [Terriglobales bacterium]